MGVIYLIINPNNKLYVGQSKNLDNRIKSYKKLGGERDRKSIIIDSIKKHGWDKHIIKVLEIVENSLLDDREMFWVKELKTHSHKYPDGMNLTIGGKGNSCNYWRTDKFRIDKLKERNRLTVGKKIPFKVKDKISNSLKHYFKTNKSVITEECRKASSDATRKEVVCYNLDGNLLGTFKSIKQAAGYFGLKRRTANDAYLGNQLHCGGVIFRSKTNVYPMTINVSGKIHIKKNKVSKIPSVLPSFLKVA